MKKCLCCNFKASDWDYTCLRCGRHLVEYEQVAPQKKMQPDEQGRLFAHLPEQKKL